MIDFTSPMQQIGKAFFIKREDLLPFSFGGNKVRIAEEFFDDMKRKGCDCIIGYGNARSNLSRAIANRAYSLGIPCHIVSPDDEDGTRMETVNSRLVYRCSAVIHPCKKTEVADTVEKVIAECKANGLKPYYIYGNKYGKGNEATPIAAYEKAYQEIVGYGFDYIFLATGTGMTQSGLLAGQQKYGGKEKIIGISVARSAAREVAVIRSFLKAYGVNANVEVTVDDSCICGGYGKYDSNIAETINNVYRQYGIPLDPTYTGKAFWGMKQWLKKNNAEDKRILFIHTGGTPLFFDYLRNQALASVKRCNSVPQLVSFLQQIDAFLPTPLMQRVDLIDYARKVSRFGEILTIERESKIVSAALFYANDYEGGRAYLTLLGTLPEYMNSGYASQLMDAAENKAKENGMREFWLETDQENTCAVSFYSRHGYQVIEINEKIKMRKTL